MSSKNHSVFSVTLQPPPHTDITILVPGTLSHFGQLKQFYIFKKRHVPSAYVTAMVTFVSSTLFSLPIAKVQAHSLLVATFLGLGSDILLHHVLMKCKKTF